jgi:hypothetical protein
VSPRLLLGTHYHPGSPETLARQARARASLLALAGVRLVNLQFPDSVLEFEGFRTAPRLFDDSVRATGREGPRKPIGREAFDRLAECAREESLPYFGWVNSDIIVTREAVEFVHAHDYDAVIFSRMDFDGATGADLGMLLGGLDAFVISTAWWAAHRERYRPYVNSESYWDPIYATLALCHGHAILLNRTGLIRHEAHPKVWRESPFADYNRHFAALDTLYLDQWQRYRDRLAAMRAAGASEDEELAWQRAAFHWPPPLAKRLWHLGRCARAWARHRWNRR